MTRYIITFAFFLMGCEGKYIQRVACEEPEIFCVEQLCCYEFATDTTDCWSTEEE